MKISINYPKQKEKIGSVYTINIVAEGAENVRVNIDDGNWVPCRYANGRWWHDWKNIEPGRHRLQAEATQANQTTTSDSVECLCGEEISAPPIPDTRINKERTLQDAWFMAQRKLKDTLGESNTRLWLDEIRPIEIQENDLVLQVPNSYFASWIDKHQSKISEALCETGAEIKKKIGRAHV